MKRVSVGVTAAKTSAASPGVNAARASRCDEKVILRRSVVVFISL
jgi:hypothetical protein